MSNQAGTDSKRCGSEALIDRDRAAWKLADARHCLAASDITIYEVPEILRNSNVRLLGDQMPWQKT